MRLLVAAVRCGKGELDANLAAHVALLERAAAAGADAVVAPEMSLTGSVDPAAHPERLVTLDGPAVRALAAATAATGVACVAGIAERTPAGSAAITQLVLAGGEVVAVQRKRHLGEGEEAFTPAPAGDPSPVVEVAGARLAVAICAESTVDGPFDAAAGRADVVAFCAAPGLDGRRTDGAGWRAGLAWWESAGLADVRRHARRLGVWVVVATQAGATEDEDFPGLAAVVDPAGRVVDRLPDWRPGVLVADVPAGPAPPGGRRRRSRP